jgi:hypothetical protein
MEAMREAWTDERLDDLSGRVDNGFRRAHDDLVELRTEIKSALASFRQETNARLDAFDRRFDTMFAALLAGFVGLIVTHFV